VTSSCTALDELLSPAPVLLPSPSHLPLLPRLRPSPCFPRSPSSLPPFSCRARAVCLARAKTARRHPPHAPLARCPCRLSRGLNGEPAGAYAVPRDVALQVRHLVSQHTGSARVRSILPTFPSLVSRLVPSLATLSIPRHRRACCPPLSIDLCSPWSLPPSLPPSCTTQHTLSTATDGAAASSPSLPLLSINPILSYLFILAYTSHATPHV
jgi:hypothetical protein